MRRIAARGLLRSVFLVLVAPAVAAFLATVASARAASPPERGIVWSAHSGLCLGGEGAPALVRCSPREAFTALPVPGSRSAFLLRRERDKACLFANADGRFAFYACTPAYPDQHWSWVPSSVRREQGEMLRSVHARRCLVSSTDRRLGLAACDDEQGDQRFRLEKRPPAPPAPPPPLTVIPPPAPSPIPPPPPPPAPSTLSPPDPSPSSPSSPSSPVVPRYPGARPVPAYAQCQSDADCMIFCPRVPGCCGWPCGCRNAIRRDAADAFTAEHARTCDRAPRCPQVACALDNARSAACRQGRCVAASGLF